jgi:ArsR family transcriptional regulator
MLEVRFFKALGDPNRIAILSRLATLGRPSTVSEVAACCPVCTSVVSRHLAMLRDTGILRAEKRGKEVYYSVCMPELVAKLRGIAEAIEACCPAQTPTKRIEP